MKVLIGPTGIQVPHCKLKPTPLQTSLLWDKGRIQFMYTGASNRAVGKTTALLMKCLLGSIEQDWTALYLDYYGHASGRLIEICDNFSPMESNFEFTKKKMQFRNGARIIFDDGRNMDKYRGHQFDFVGFDRPSIGDMRECDDMNLISLVKPGQLIFDIQRITS